MKNNTALGQHWLKDRILLEQIADYAAEQPAPLCLEIGPGLGTLTSSLLRRFPQVVAVELDERLATNLGRSFPGKNLIVKNQDVLQLDLNQFNNQDYVVAGNIPYYITTPILKHLLASPHLPKRIVLLVQKEFAEKMYTHSSPLAYFLANFAQLSLGLVVKRALFTPPPKVDSQVLILDPYPTPLYPNYTPLNQLISRAFLAPRKKLLSNLTTLAPKATLIELFQAQGLSLDARPASLTLKDYAKLAEKLESLYNKNN